MQPKNDRLLSFASVYQSIRAENLLVQEGIRVLAIPTPREIDLSCGQCLLFNAASESRIMDLLQEAGVQWSKLYRRDGEARVYEKIYELEG